jgi:hypothetical protein
MGICREECYRIAWNNMRDAGLSSVNAPLDRIAAVRDRRRWWNGLTVSQQCALVCGTLLLGAKSSLAALMSLAEPVGRILAMTYLLTLVGFTIRVLHDAAVWLFQAAEALREKRRSAASESAPVAQQARATAIQDLLTMPLAELKRRYPAAAREGQTLAAKLTREEALTLARALHQMASVTEDGQQR